MMRDRNKITREKEVLLSNSKHRWPINLDVNVRSFIEKYTKVKDNLKLRSQLLMTLEIDMADG